VDGNGTRLQMTRWFLPDRNIVVTKNDGTPYCSNSNRVSTLVIPTFNGSYDGTYTCGIGNDYPPKPMTTFTVTLPGVNIINCLINYVSIVESAVHIDIHA